jgi:hypothetical protein
MTVESAAWGAAGCACVGSPPTEEAISPRRRLRVQICMVGQGGAASGKPDSVENVRCQRVHAGTKGSVTKGPPLRAPALPGDFSEP